MADNEKVEESLYFTRSDLKKRASIEVVLFVITFGLSFIYIPLVAQGILFSLAINIFIMMIYNSKYASNLIPKDYVPLLSMCVFILIEDYIYIDASEYHYLIQHILLLLILLSINKLFNNNQ